MVRPRQSVDDSDGGLPDGSRHEHGSQAGLPQPQLPRRRAGVPHALQGVGRAGGVHGQEPDDVRARVHSSVVNSVNNMINKHRRHEFSCVHEAAYTKLAARHACRETTFTHICSERSGRSTTASAHNYCSSLQCNATESHLRVGGNAPHGSCPGRQGAVCKVLYVPEVAQLYSLKKCSSVVNVLAHSQGGQRPRRGGEPHSARRTEETKERRRDVLRVDLRVVRLVCEQHGHAHNVVQRAPDLREDTL